MALTEVPIELSSAPGIVDNSTGTAITIDASGNVDVTGTVTADGLTVNTIAVAVSQENGVLFGANAQYGMQLKQYTTSGGTPHASVVAPDDTNGWLSIEVGGDQNEAARFASNGDISFYEDTGTTAKFFWDASAESLGIGTSSPNTPLQVSGANSSTNADALFSVQKTTEGYGLFSGVLATGVSWLQGGTSDDLTYYNLALQPNGGRVGIGTSSPDTLLNLESAAPTVRLAPTTQNNSSSLELGVLNAGTTAYAKIDAVNLTTYDTNLRFFTNTTTSTTQVERMRIDSSGNLLVGTSGVAVDLLSPNANVITDAAFGINNGSNKAQFSLDRINFNSGQYYVLNENNIGVILTNGQTSWGSQSDESLKENISDLGPVLDKVTNYRCVNYSLKATQSASADKIGFIAQDWESDFPNVVDVDENGLLTMRYTETIPVLLKAIQEQQDLIESLTARIAQLEGAN